MTWQESETIGIWEALKLVRQTDFPTWYGMNMEDMEYPVGDSAAPNNMEGTSASYKILYFGNDETVVREIAEYSDYEEDGEFELSIESREDALEILNALIREIYNPKVEG